MKHYSQYIMQDSPKTKCKCGGESPVRLLCRQDGNMENYPAFYCCSDCGFVGQVGVGEVLYIEKD